MAEILIVDDDVELCELLADYLGREGYAVTATHDGARGLELAAEGDYDLVILDVMLPGCNGFEVLRRLREGSQVPVLMLTARGEDVDRIVGLELGADDYLPKPFNPRELVARMRAVRRRFDAPVSPAAVESEPLRVGDVELHPGARWARCRSVELRLTSAELVLLEMLLRSAGRVVSREELCVQVLGRRFNPYDRAIDVHVSNLRKKLGPSPAGGERIKTVRGAGYVYARE